MNLDRDDYSIHHLRVALVIFIAVLRKMRTTISQEFLLHFRTEQCADQILHRY